MFTLSFYLFHPSPPRLLGILLFEPLVFFAVFTSVEVSKQTPAPPLQSSNSPRPETNVLALSLGQLLGMLVL